MRSPILSFILLFISFTGLGAETDYTFKLEGTRTEEGKVFTGHGTAVAVDLTAYGRPGKRYLLTCAHLVDGYTDHRILVETKFRSCQVLWKDAELDLCVLQCDTELTAAADLAMVDPAVKDRFTTVGYPEGQKSALLRGEVVKEVGIVRQAQIKDFAHGCSGSGLFSNGRLIGLATGFVGDGGGREVKDFAYFMPVRRIKMFLMYSAVHKE